MAQQRDYYEVLGVDKNANADAIKKAYRNRPSNIIPTNSHQNRMPKRKRLKKNSSRQQMPMMCFPTPKSVRSMTSSARRWARRDSREAALAASAGSVAEAFTMEDIFSRSAISSEVAAWEDSLRPALRWRSTAPSAAPWHRPAHHHQDDSGRHRFGREQDSQDTHICQRRAM